MAVRIRHSPATDSRTVNKTAKVSKMRIRIHEVPISYHPRTTEEGKKIGFKDGLRAIYSIWKYRNG